ncbi:hypothetical protein BC829DRAFT_381159 [Chytridium lagenaria]|nr:hypothetical protein BC829DRAFT_381159 [Chytridium lagenaria]
MTRIARKRMHTRVRDIKRSSRTRARTKDLDQIHDDMKQPEKCARHFTSEVALSAHLFDQTTQEELLKETPYTQAEAEAAVGMGTDNGKREKVAMEVEAL